MVCGIQNMSEYVGCGPASSWFCGPCGWKCGPDIDQEDQDAQGNQDDLEQLRIERSPAQDSSGAEVGSLHGLDLEALADKGAL